MGQPMERDTERKAAGFERESSRSKGSSLPPTPTPPKKTSCGRRSDTFINSAHVPHFFFFSFFFEVILQPERERGEVSQILACGQTIFPLGGVGPIHSDLNSLTLEYLVNE